MKAEIEKPKIIQVNFKKAKKSNSSLKTSANVTLKGDTREVSLFSFTNVKNGKAVGCEARLIAYYDFDEKKFLRGYLAKEQLFGLPDNLKNLLDKNFPAWKKENPLLCQIVLALGGVKADGEIIYLNRDRLDDRFGNLKTKKEKEME